MAEPQLSVRSARARELAHKLAVRENRTVADIVERALESYATREAGQEPADVFFRRLTENAGEDFDLDAVIREHRKPHHGIDL